jgi:hypothetical protein
MPSGFEAFVALKARFLGRFVGSGVSCPAPLPATLVGNVLFLTEPARLENGPATAKTEKLLASLVLPGKLLHVLYI